MKKQQTTSFMLLILYGLLICGLLVLAVTGAQSYATVTEAKNKHIRERSALSFVQTQIASCGGRDNVQLRSGPEGTAVCVREMLLRTAYFCLFFRILPNVKPSTPAALASSASICILYLQESLT